MKPPERESPPPSAASVFPMITAYMTSQVIYAAARLGIAELLQDGAKSGDELARATGTHAPSLRRLLRGLAVVGVVDEIEPGRFELTSLGALLRPGLPGSVRNLALLFVDEPVWRAWGAPCPGSTSSTTPTAARPRSSRRRDGAWVPVARASSSPLFAPSWRSSAMSSRAVT